MYYCPQIQTGDTFFKMTISPGQDYIERDVTIPPGKNFLFASNRSNTQYTLILKGLAEVPVIPGEWVVANDLATPRNIAFRINCPTKNCAGGVILTSCQGTLLK